jgi:hypothetical protein
MRSPKKSANRGVIVRAGPHEKTSERKRWPLLIRLRSFVKGNDLATDLNIDSWSRIENRPELRTPARSIYEKRF